MSSNKPDGPVVLEIAPPQELYDDICNQSVKGGKQVHSYNAAIALYYRTVIS